MGSVALSIDVEDWFCVRNMGDQIRFRDWHDCELRVRVGLDFILTELAERKIQATFFVLGWIAERVPDLVAELVSAGHEVASHGYNHQPIDTMSREEFRADVQRSLTILSAQAGLPIRGYRAPSFSVTQETFWALDVLAELGFEYDSSIFPVRHPNYGIVDFPRRLTKVAGLTEVPMTSVDRFGVRLPVSGGGYFRIYPYALTKRLLTQAQAEGDVVLYFHPWEFDDEQPRVKLPSLQRFRHYVGLNKNRDKFRRLLDDFTFCSIRDLVGRVAVH